MKRIDTSTKSIDLYGAGKDGFTDGNPGSGVPATQLNASWFNTLQEEIAHVVEAVGSALNPASLTQLYDSICSLITGIGDGRYLRLVNVRTKLTANMILYVATTGNDSNDGTVGSPFLTLSKAWSVIKAYDLNGYQITVQLADGTYNAGVTCGGVAVGSSGYGNVVWKGNTATPANVIVNEAAGVCFNATVGCSITVKDMKLTGNTGLSASYGGFISFSNIVFGTCTGQHLSCTEYGQVYATGNYSIAGNAPIHAQANGMGSITIAAVTVTLTGTPAFSSCFAQASSLAFMSLTGNTFSGAATGSRYSSSVNSVINTSGGGASYLPGNAVGTTATGGLYV